MRFEARRPFTARSGQTPADPSSLAVALDQRAVGPPQRSERCERRCADYSSPEIAAGIDWSASCIRSAMVPSGWWYGAVRAAAVFAVGGVGGPTVRDLADVGVFTGRVDDGGAILRSMLIWSSSVVLLLLTLSAHRSELLPRWSTRRASRDNTYGWAFIIIVTHTVVAHCRWLCR